MASDKLKTSVAIEMDASGMAKGAAAAKNELDKLKRAGERTAFATGLTASLQAAQMAFSAVAGLVRSLDARVSELTQLGATWSREGVSGAAAEETAKLRRDQAIGGLMGGAAEAASRTRSEAMRLEVFRAQEHASGIAGGAAYWESIKSDLAAVWTGIKDSTLAAVGGDYSLGPVSAAYQATGADAKWEEVFSEILETLKSINASSSETARSVGGGL